MMILFHPAISFDYKKKLLNFLLIKLLLIKLWSLEKTVYILKIRIRIEFYHRNYGTIMKIFLVELVCNKCRPITSFQKKTCLHIDDKI